MGNPPLKKKSGNTVSPIVQMVDKIKHYSDEELLIIWKNLSSQSWGSDDYWDPINKITMDVWANYIYIEMNLRGIEIEQ